jgi:nuclear GTP-binding protein
MEKKQQTSSREDLIQALKRKMEMNNTSDVNTIEMLRSEANYKEELYNANMNNINEEDDELKLNVINKDMSRKAYMRELKQVIENSDVILEVLDIRDPLSCRSKELESQVLSHKDEKKLILVLNKIDLVPL